MRAPRATAARPSVSRARNALTPSSSSWAPSAGCDGRWGWSGWWRIGGDMVKSTGRRGGLQSRWARGGGVLFLAGTLGWILFSAGQVIFLRIFSLFNVLTISKIRLLIVSHVWGLHFDKRVWVD